MLVAKSLPWLICRNRSASAAETITTATAGNADAADTASADVGADVGADVS
jgi:hypothetical protein